MQLKSTIIDTFSRRGYMQHIQITKREFHILMNTLLVAIRLYFSR